MNVYITGYSRHYLKPRILFWTMNKCKTNKIKETESLIRRIKRRENLALTLKRSHMHKQCKTCVGDIIRYINYFDDCSILL